ncbi:MAG: hypothetical protein MUF20_09050 [Methylotetracoccus sp.]|nr:hypothetical protein [Methylotetracoccus sp.]
MNAFIRHPFFVLGFGMILGYHLRKYRREIIDAADRSDASSHSAFGIVAEMLSGIQQGARDATRNWTERHD